MKNRKAFDFWFKCFCIFKIFVSIFYPILSRNSRTVLFTRIWEGGRRNRQKEYSHRTATVGLIKIVKFFSPAIREELTESAFIKHRKQAEKRHNFVAVFSVLFYFCLIFPRKCQMPYVGSGGPNGSSLWFSLKQKLFVTFEICWVLLCSVVSESLFCSFTFFNFSRFSVSVWVCLCIILWLLPRIPLLFVYSCQILISPSTEEEEEKEWRLLFYLYLFFILSPGFLFVCSLSFHSPLFIITLKRTN